MKRITCFLMTAFFAFAAYCQDAAVALVGNRAILESDVAMKMREQNVDYDTALADLVQERLLLVQADREGIKVTQDELSEEIDRIIGSFPDERTFMLQLEEAEMPYRLFRKMIEQQLKIRKLMRQKVGARVRVTTPEIAAMMEEMKSRVVRERYNFRLKWFDDISEAEEFISGFTEADKQGMSDAGWMSAGELLNEVLSALEGMERGELSPPLPVIGRFLVLFLNDFTERETDFVSLYSMARNSLYNARFFDELEKYLQELRSTIPVSYSGKN